MQEQFDPTLIGIALLLWSAAKSIVLLSAMIASIFSDDPSRREVAERIIERILGPGARSKNEIEDP